MSLVTIRCPHCSFSREVPAETIPGGEVRVTCPQCRQTFVLTAPPPIPADAADAAQPAPDTPPHETRAETTPLVAAAVETPAAAPRREPPPRRPPPLRGLMPIGELMERTWTVYKERVGTLILLYLVSLLLVVLPLGLLAGVGVLVTRSITAFVVLAFIALLTVPLLGTWGWAALVCATADEELGVAEALRRSRELIVPFFWLFSLQWFIICGGYLLLIIPGILFTVWFFMAQYILAEEGTRGMEALLKSREYVRGYGWGVFGRLSLVMVAAGILGAIPFIGPFLSLAATPYVMLWVFLIYRELRAIKGEPAYDCGTRVKSQWLLRGAAGYVFVPLLLAAFYGPMLYHMGREVAAGNWSALMMPELKLPAGLPAPPPSSSETIRPADFPLLNGEWKGTELGSGESWNFAFDGQGYGVTVQRPDGGWYAGQAVIRYDMGERDGSIRVPPGWSVLDVEVASATAEQQAGKVALGTFSVHGDELQLCLGEPGGTVRTQEFASSGDIRCFNLVRTAGTAGTPVYQYPADAGQSAGSPSAAPTAPDAKPDDISVFIYAANYTGGVRINGREFKTFGAKKDMQYNYSLFGSDFFAFGTNSITVDYAPLAELPPDYWLLEIHIKVSRGDRVLGDWTIKERSGGSKTYTIDIPR